MYLLYQNISHSK